MRSRSGTLLRQAGYRTQAIGKWHLGDKSPYLPLDHGLNTTSEFPTPWTWPPAHLYRDNRIVDDLAGSKVETVTERYTEEAIEFVRRTSKGNRAEPFFLYFSHTIPHPPLNLPPHARTPGRALYDDAIEHMDQQTGLLLRALDDAGVRDNTLVFFSSDNGPMAPGGQTGGCADASATPTSGVRVPMIAAWPGRIPEGRVADEPAIACDIFPTLARAAGTRMPDDRVYDGQDITHVLTGQGEFARREPFFWVYLDRVTTIRDGKWKLHVASREKTLEQPELYDVNADAASPATWPRRIGGSQTSGVDRRVSERCAQRSGACNTRSGTRARFQAASVANRSGYLVRRCTGTTNLSAVWVGEKLATFTSTIPAPLPDAMTSLCVMARWPLG
ncbi:MAG: sulfatase-like hydrolase/transferase [Bryobacteraceae bacterium]